MLKINEDQMAVFSEIQYSVLRKKIDYVLNHEVLSWKKRTQSNKQKVLSYLIVEAEKAGFRHDDAFIYFSLICMVTNENYQSFLKRKDVIEITNDKRISEGGKLVLLSNIISINLRDISLQEEKNAT